MVQSLLRNLLNPVPTLDGSRRASTFSSCLQQMEIVLSSDQRPPLGKNKTQNYTSLITT